MINNSEKLLVKMDNAGVFLDNKWLVKDVSLEIEKGKIMKPESYFKPNIKQVLGLIKD